jgi:hypothetical protein
MLSVTPPTFLKVQYAPPKALSASVRSITTALCYNIKQRGHIPKVWLSSRDIWVSVVSYRGNDHRKKFLRNIVKLAYYVERRYSKIVLFDWAMLESNPGWIANRILLAIGIKAEKPDEYVRPRRRRHTGQVMAGGMPVPDDMPLLKRMVPKYYPSTLRKVGLGLEARSLAEAGLPVPPEFDIPGFEYHKSHAREWKDLYKEVRPPKEFPPPAKKAGNKCPKCRSPLEPFLAQSRTQRYECRGDSYWDAYGLSQTGLYTSSELVARFPETMTEHRRRFADRRWEECHPLRCTKNPRHSKYSNLYTKGVKLTTLRPKETTAYT